MTDYRIEGGSFLKRFLAKVFLWWQSGYNGHEQHFKYLCSLGPEKLWKGGLYVFMWPVSTIAPVFPIILLMPYIPPPIIESLGNWVYVCCVGLSLSIALAPLLFWMTMLKRVEKDLEDGFKTLEGNRETLEHDGDALEREENTLAQTLEQQKVDAEPMVLTLEQPNQDRVQASEKPSKEDLAALKKVLGIEKGSLQHKRRGDGVYLVTYNSETKGRDWVQLGTWSELKKLIYQKASADSGILS